MIPDEAVEAAARAIAETGTAGWVKGEWDDPDIAEKLRDEARAWACAALEAAAPHMLAPIHAHLTDALRMTTQDPNAILEPYDQGFDDAIRGMAEKIRAVMNGLDQVEAQRAARTETRDS